MEFPIEEETMGCDSTQKDDVLKIQDSATLANEMNFLREKVFWSSQNFVYFLWKVEYLILFDFKHSANYLDKIFMLAVHITQA